MTSIDAYHTWRKEYESDHDKKPTYFEVWQEATKAERERCALIAERGYFLHDNAPDARFGKACAKAIRGE